MADVFVVEMVDNVSAPAARAAAATRNVQRAVIGLDAALKAGDRAQLDAAQSALKLARSTEQAAIAGAKLQGAFTPKRGGFGRLVGSIAAGVGVANLASRAIDGIGGAIKGAFDLNVNATGVRRALLLMSGGDAKAAEASFERIRTEAQNLGAPFDEVAQRFLQLRRAGFQDNDATQFVRWREDLLALGTPVADAEAALDSLSKILVTGKLNPKALNGLEQAGVPAKKAISALALSSGKTFDQVVKDFNDGKIPVSAFAREVERAFTGNGAEALGLKDAKADAGSLQGALGDLRGAIESGVLVPLLGGATAGEGFALAIQKIATTINQNAPQIISALKDIGGAAGVLGDVGKFVGAVWKENIGFIGDVILSIDNAQAKMEKSARGRGGGFVPPAALGASAALDAMGNPLGQALTDGMANGIKDGAPVVAAAATGLANQVESAAAGALEIRSPSRVMMRQGREIDAGLAAGIDADADLAMTAAKEMTEGTRDAAAAGLEAPGALVGRDGSRAATTLVEAPGGSGVQINVGGVTVNARGAGGANGEADDVADAIGAWFERELSSTLERAAAAAGIV